MIPNFPWFGPGERLGIGWAPITMEGRLITLFTFALFLAILFVHGASKRSAFGVAGLLSFFLAIIVMTSVIGA